MKNKVFLFALMIYVLLNCITPVCAKEYLKNFYAYEVKNVNIREFGVIAKNAIESYTGPDRGIPVKDVDNAYIYTGQNYTYFVKLYPANQNTHIYVVSNEKYDVHNNDITVFLKKCGYTYNKLNDKSALKEYQNDFYVLARKQKLGNFYITPDLVKPLKNGMTKLNNMMSKNSKKSSVLPYSNDYEPIDLTCIDTIGYYDEKSKIAILRKEYRLKQKENRYMHAFEYVVTNKNNDTATISVSSERVAGMKDVATEAGVDLDRIDAISAVGSFPPLIICTCGLSLIACLPSWLSWVNITKEATRYAHSLPENYQLRPQGYMRILVLKYKQNQKPLDFTVTFPTQTYNVSF